MHIAHKMAGVSAAISIAIAAWFVGCVGDEPATGAASDGGTSEGSSADGTTAGDAACGDTTSDSQNCGACGHPCATGFSCDKSVCGNEPVELAAEGLNGLGGVPNGQDTVCALLASGDVYCWGWNNHGQLGISTSTTNTSAPTKVPGIAAASHVAVGVGHACAVLRTDGSVWCWGENAYGQTGRTPADAGSEMVTLPAQVGTTSGYAGVTAHGFSSCALDGSGHVSCWGSNDRGSLGHAPGTDGDLSTNTGTCTAGTPVFCYDSAAKSVDAGAGVLSVASFDNGLCAIDSAGQVHCWGDEGFNDNGATPADQGANGPIQINSGGSPLANLSALFAGRDTICAVGSAPGTGYCWGQNQESQLGNNAPTAAGDWPGSAVAFGDSDASTAFTDVTGFALGWMHVCALRSDGSVWCAGRDQEGELGVPLTRAMQTCTFGFAGTACATTPVQVSGVGGTGTLSGATTLAAGRASTCAIVKNGLDASVVCWGNNSGGELGHPVGSSGDQSCDAGAGCTYNPFPTKVDGLPH